MHGKKGTKKKSKCDVIMPKTLRSKKIRTLLLPEHIETLYVIKKGQKLADLRPEQKHKMHAHTMWGKETDTTVKLQ